MPQSHTDRNGRTSRRSRSRALSARRRQPERGRFEALESRCLLSASAEVAIGAPQLVAFHDSDATAGTTFTPQAIINVDGISATVLKTSKMLKMQVSFTAASGTKMSGEMDFLLLDDVAPNRISRLTTLVNQGFYTDEGTGDKYKANTFHRIIADFMVQGGDPQGTGYGGSGVKLDNEYNADVQFTTSGLLAMANSGPDTDDSQFFITAGPYQAGDFGYTIFGKLVAGDSIREALNGVKTTTVGVRENVPLYSATIDSMTIVSNTEYGLMLLKADDTASTIELATYGVAASDGSSVEIIASDGGTGSTIDITATPAETPSAWRPVFLTDGITSGIHVTADSQATIDIPVAGHTSGLTLSYSAEVVTGGSNITVSAAGTNATNGKLTIVTSGGVTGLYSVKVSVNRAGSSYVDSQVIPVYIGPAAPTAIAVTDTAVVSGGTTTKKVGIDFTVTGVESGKTVAIYVNGQSDPIGTAVATGTTVHVITTVPLADGSHEFTAKQGVQYTEKVVGNNTIPAGTAYSPATGDSVAFTVDTTPPSAVGYSDNVQLGAPATFVVNFSDSGSGVDSSTVDGNDFVVTGPNGYHQIATLKSATTAENGKGVRATYQIAAPSGGWNANAGRYTVTLQAGQVSDRAGNSVLGHDVFSFNPVDLTTPTVTVEQAAGQTDPTGESTINFTATFSESVTGFTSEGVTIAGTAGATTAEVTDISGDGTKYNIAVTGMTHVGTVIVSLPTGAGKDKGGNLSSSSINVDNTVTYDNTGPKVVVSLASDQAAATNGSTINFTVVFRDEVTDFAAGDAVVSGTAGATTAIVTGSGKTYNVEVTGMVRDGTVILNVPANVAHNSLGNPNSASTGKDNVVIYDHTSPAVTVNQAATQSDPSGASAVHFTVVFSEPVTGFSSTDVTIGGTVWGNLKATVTGSGAKYDVAITGMGKSGTIVVTIGADVVSDAAGNKSTASTSTDNTVNFILANPPTFRLTAPVLKKATIGQTVTVAWNIANVYAGTKVSVCYDKDQIWNGNEVWLTHTVTAANGYGTYQWKTTGLSAGTYYVAGYLDSGGQIRSRLAQPIVLVSPPPATFRMTSPVTSVTCVAGKNVTIGWTSSNAPTTAAINVCYDVDKTWNGNEKWLSVGKTATNTYGSYTWNTAGLASGTYYVGGYIKVNGKTLSSRLATRITIVAPTPVFRVTAPTSGAYTVGQTVPIWFWGDKVAAGNKVSLCYDKDTTFFNGNEKWIEVDQATATNGYGRYDWDTAAVAPGKYYVAGYLWANGKATFSHLTSAITIKAGAALNVDASALRPSSAERVTDQELQPILAEAQRRLTASTGIGVASAVSDVSVRIADLPGNMLGEVVGNSIIIDADAAGYGWFVDSTPADDREFGDSLDSNVLTAGKDAASRVDLLTTVIHEMLHVLGAGHSDARDLMSPTLLPGERRLPNEYALLPLLEMSALPPSGSKSSDADLTDLVFGSAGGDSRRWILPS
jgi:cyclophilin family peptidyl-prolyl cis-trans isomerase